MTWKIHDEFIDLPRARHVAIFRNAQTGGEHHIVYEFGLKKCAHCGRPHEDLNGELLDFRKIKDDTLEALNEHHAKVTKYRERHPHVALRSTPLK